MKTCLTRGLGNEETKRLQEAFVRASDFRKFLREKLEELIRESRESSYKEEDYSLPSWPYKQADKLGYEKALKKIFSYLE